MELLFIIFIAVVVIGFTIIVCVGCYCSCCHTGSYSSSSSHYSERRQGEYKANATAKSSNTLEYDQHHWNSAATLPLITPPEYRSTSSLSSYPNRQPPPVGFEHVAKSQTESNQTINSSGFHSYGDNSSPRPPYPTNQEIVTRTSQHTTVNSSYSPQPNTPTYPNNKHGHSSNFETTTMTYSPSVTVHPPYPSDSAITETTYYTKTASPYPPYPTNTISSYPATNSNKTTSKTTSITTATDLQQRPNSYNTISHPPAYNYFVPAKAEHPISNRSDYAVETVDFHPSTKTVIVSNTKKYPQPPQPTETSSSTTVTTYTTETTIPSNFNTMPANRNFYYNKQAPPANIETVNESYKSKRIITKHPSTGSLYDNM